MAVYKDGTFYGNFHDNDLGDIGNAYPNGTVYICNFNGKFNLVEQKNAYTFELVLDELKTDIADISWIKDGTLYITSEPYGLESGKHFLLYTPNAPLDELPENFLFWWNLRYSDVDKTNRLNTYALYCEELGCAFLSNRNSNALWM